MKYAKDLSVIIPSRNERFLKQTIDDILENIEADTDIIAFLDGSWGETPIPQHERVNIIHSNKVLGQRGGANRCAAISRAKYIMKVDAHCSFDKGFDRKMIEGFEKVGDNCVMVPIMRNLWAFDWKCFKCGWKTYQGPKPEVCGEEDYKGTGEPCGGTDIRRKIVWKGKSNPQSKSYCFDPTSHFQYFNNYKKTDKYKEEEKTGFTETMSLQGSCFMATREKYWEWELSDEKLGNWGNQGVEVACKAWLAGGKVLVNHNTWYAHMFRTKGGPEWGFPWQISGNAVQKTKNNVKDLFWENKWHKQTRPLKWLVKRFWPVDGWEQKDIDNLPDTLIESTQSPTT